MLRLFFVLTLLLVVLLRAPVWAQSPVTVTLRPDYDPILEEFVAVAPVSLSLSDWYALGWLPGLFGAWAMVRR